jgi:hypothetical protein
MIDLVVGAELRSNLDPLRQRRDQLLEIFRLHLPRRQPFADLVDGLPDLAITETKATGTTKDRGDFVNCLPFRHLSDPEPRLVSTLVD